jgi:2-polyprenyl-3-methyl-5-hydroxy-6-metoxy-1,4-benzoquinol methylase
LRAVEAKALLCFNVLEHLEDRERFASACASLLPHGGLIAISVPYSFPYHPDPIDTLFRPKPAEVAELFPAFRLSASGIVECESFGTQLMASPRKLAGWLARLVVPHKGLEHWRSAVDRARWLLRPYRVTCLMLVRMPQAAQ